MRIEERVTGRLAVLSVSGNLMSGEACSQLTGRVRRLLDYDCRCLVLDVVQLRHVDSAGLGALVEACVATRHRGASMALFGVSDRLRDLLVATRLITLFGDGTDDSETLEGVPRIPTVN